MRALALVFAVMLVACGDDAAATSDAECVPVPNCVELPSGATCERCPDAGGAEP